MFSLQQHGGQTKDLNGDEEDGTDETIYPVSHQQDGMIVDDEVSTLFLASE